jgi:exopolysaccharide biosynthesis polyprenyl glycosylphosphotransferase
MAISEFRQRKLAKVPPPVPWAEADSRSLPHDSEKLRAHRILPDILAVIFSLVIAIVFEWRKGSATTLLVTLGLVIVALTARRLIDGILLDYSLNERGFALKRVLDFVFSGTALLLLWPILLLIGIAIKFDSHGPVLYSSERIGKKGRVFRCFKFRTMVRDAEDRRASMTHMNERDGVLFKISNDPRITRVGRILRKYSLDELPQFFNVLRGDMSVVGPRPPVASEVKEYKLNELRRLAVTPGITGLWQIQLREDPSFDSYVSLDLTYIENWSIWLDIKIIVRTVGVMVSGTGT